MIRMMWLVALAAAVAGAPQQAAVPGNWTQKVDPYRVVGNIYYVGSQDLSSFLITSPEGHVLIDSGVAQNAPLILDNIRSLGFQPGDVKLLLTTQAHYDHVAAFAALKAATGARVAASAADARLLEDGGKSDYLFGPDYNFPPVTVDQIVKDGETLAVGGTSLTAHLTPGHTRGAMTYTMDVKDARGRSRKAVFLASTSVNPGTALVNNTTYPGIADDYRRTFEIEKSLPCEVFLAAHASQFRGNEKAARAAAGLLEEPFIDPEGCKAAIERSEKAFEAELAKQQGKHGAF
jgi:metallo-beta-lactamase class B